MLTPTVGLLEEFARAADVGDHPPIAGPLSAHAALMDDLIDTWQARGIDVGRLEHVKGLVDRGIAEGHGPDGFSSPIGAVKERGGIFSDREPRARGRAARTFPQGRLHPCVAEFVPWFARDGL